MCSSVRDVDFQFLNGLVVPAQQYARYLAKSMANIYVLDEKNQARMLSRQLAATLIIFFMKRIFLRSIWKHVDSCASAEVQSAKPHRNIKKIEHKIDCELRERDETIFDGKRKQYTRILSTSNKI